MTDTELTTLSTIAWIIATVTLFMLLASWSNGTDLGVTTGIVRGVRGWRRHASGIVQGPGKRRSSTAGELPPLDLAPRDPSGERAQPDDDPAAEIEEL
jgi:hypothetical protein